MITFRVLTGMTLVVFALAIPLTLTAWTHADFQQDGLVEPWLETVEGTIDTIGWFAVLGLFLKPFDRVVLAHYVIAAALVAITVIPAAGASMLLTLALVLLPIASYPSPRQLLKWPPLKVNTSAMITAIVGAALLLPIAATSSSSTDNNTATYAEHLTALAIAGLLAATRRPGWQWIGWPTAAAWVYLGTVAVVFPNDHHSIGTIAGIAGIATGLSFTVCFTRRTAPR